ncbi:DUF1564 family protein [Leptospira gomenensis]|uniref:DUF1564 family protein n=1 Tax=Leptospira gomenensis TaxID=2484974 RepID=A0A5F1YC25_9LEPT|nr:DUF1564 family protein [Leptospira gomenensis]TGK34501.1 DUF1564 family protein [Leptospira gomenensis]TGK40189.1 DUF1564 family protein [Leptospira gomenensis]TGK41886.1 DUF1564 family protein [Leptospira gomenensis]TGK55698.1 DUF1564 family protein [Leptospira gomenensis]
MGMRTIQFKDKNSKKLSLAGLKVTCSFLIPAKLFYRLTSRERRVIGKNLPFLLKKFSAKLTTSPRIGAKTLTIRYQRPGKNLIKINARVDGEDWAQLGILAASHSVSRCLLYCFLLELLNSNNSLPKKVLKKEPQNFIFLWDFDSKRKILKRFLFIKSRFFYESFDNYK